MPRFSPFNKNSVSPAFSTSIARSIPSVGNCWRHRDADHNWVNNRSQKWGVPIQEDPPGRRDDFVERYYRRAQPDQVVAIIKAREPATILKPSGKTTVGI